jgi:hypothetical protein
LPAKNLFFIFAFHLSFVPHRGHLR